MYRPPPPIIPNDAQWRVQRPPQNFHWRPNYVNRPRVPYRNPNYINYRPSINTGKDDYWCETCDRGFPNENLFNQHKQQHQKCNIDGCQFIAHPKVITKHIQMQHSSGLYKKIANIKNPEDIEKWREERRKKYPTKANVEKKAAAVKEKIERGEKMGLVKGNKFINKNFQKDNNLKRSINKNCENVPDSKLRKTNSYNKFEKKTPLGPKKPPKLLPQIEEKRKLRPFAGIQSLIENDVVDDVPEGFNEDLIQDDEVEPIEKLNESVVKSNVCVALSSLICDYGSSDEDIKERSPTNSSITRLNTNAKDNGSDKTDIIEKNNHDTICKTLKLREDQKNQEENDDSGPEEVNFVKNENVNEIQEKVLKSTHRDKKKNEFVRKPIFRKPKPKMPSTLLHKLLAKEMQQERNIVLQCIRYITKNNYFMK